LAIFELNELKLFTQSTNPKSNHLHAKPGTNLQNTDLNAFIIS